MAKKLTVSPSPHVRSSETTTGIMLDVIISLVPALIMSVVYFGLRALALSATTVGSAVLAEYISRKAMKRKGTLGDLSAVVTGILLALNIPSTIPLWQAVVGSFIAIVVVKCLFGGIGRNFANPAITARVVMLIAFTGTMTDIVFPVQKVDTVATATPLSALPMGGVEAVDASLLDMFLGVRGGALGETSAAALLLGFVYLLVRGIITWHTPVVFIGTVFLGSLAITGDVTTALYYTLSGGLFIGAIFMATDYVTSPSTPWGKVVFGLGCGIITLLIRFYGSYPEGVSFSILFMNILNPYIEKWTMRKPLGGVKA